MLGAGISPAVQRSLLLAQDEAARYGHPYIGTEHLVLGLLGEQANVAGAVISECGADPASIRGWVERIIGAAPGSSRVTGPAVPYTSRAKKSIELAMSEAAGMNAGALGTGHLLLGLLLEANGPGGLALAESGIDLDRARRAFAAVQAAGAADPD